MNIKNPLFNANGGFLCLGRVWCGARDGSTAIPPVVARIFSGDSTSPLTREASVVVRGEGIVRSGGHGGVMWSLLKHYALLPDTILTSAEN